MWLYTLCKTKNDSEAEKNALLDTLNSQLYVKAAEKTSSQRKLSMK